MLQSSKHQLNRLNDLCYNEANFSSIVLMTNATIKQTSAQKIKWLMLQWSKLQLNRLNDLCYNEANISSIDLMTQATMKLTLAQ